MDKETVDQRIDRIERVNETLKDLLTSAALLKQIHTRLPDQVPDSLTVDQFLQAATSVLTMSLSHLIGHEEVGVAVVVQDRSRGLITHMSTLDTITVFRALADVAVRLEAEAKGRLQ